MVDQPNANAFHQALVQDLLNKHGERVSGQLKKDLIREAKQEAAELYSTLHGSQPEIEHATAFEDLATRGERPSWWLPGTDLRSSLETYLRELADRNAIKFDSAGLELAEGYFETPFEIEVLKAFFRARDEEAEYVRLTEGVLADLALEMDLIAFRDEDGNLVLYRLDDATPSQVREQFLGAQKRERVNFATGPIHHHMYRHLANQELTTQELLVKREGGQRLELEARSTVDLPEGVTLLHDPEELLAKMQSSILERKRHSAGLLKTHLDLMDRAFSAGGELPLFEYDLRDALTRLGHSRTTHGSLHTDTMQQHYGRVVTLASQWINIWEVKKGARKVYVDQAPYWVIQARRQIVEGEELDLMQVLLTDKRAPIYTKVFIQPGLWWRAADMGRYHLHIPRAILELPIDGNGNETERMALQLTATLAVWVRSSQRLYAGKEVTYTVGTLLETSGIATWENFTKQHAQTSKRLRMYLAGETFTAGALGLLRELGAFEIDIKDDADFCAAGRGWKEKFWQARLKVRIPDMKVPKQLP